MGPVIKNQGTKCRAAGCAGIRFSEDNLMREFKCPGRGCIPEQFRKEFRRFDNPVAVLIFQRGNPLLFYLFDVFRRVGQVECSQAVSADLFYRISFFTGNLYW